MNNAYRSALCLICLLFCTITVTAQSPGYMGKKTSVQFNFSSSLVWLGTTANNNGSNAYMEIPTRYKMGFNTKYGASFNRSIGRRVSIEASADYGKTGYHNRFETLSVFDGAVGGGSTDRHDLFLNARFTDLALAMRFFNKKKGSISPLGLYFGPRIGYTMVQSEILDRRTEFHFLSDSTRINALGLNARNNYYTIGFTTGYNRIINDVLIINFSWDFAQYISADKYDEPNWGMQDKTTYETQNKIEQRIVLRQRLSGMNIFLFRIGFGYLF